jgi:hypothetical protein
MEGYVMAYFQEGSAYSRFEGSVTANQKSAVAPGKPITPPENWLASRAKEHSGFLQENAGTSTSSN